MLLAGLLVSGSLAPVTAHPHSEPDHGLDPEAFYALWARGDGIQADSENASNPAAKLQGRVYVPLRQPPTAAATWNRGEQTEIPQTGVDTVAVPSGVSTTDGALVQDAYVTILGVTPSTRVHSGESSALAVGSAGSVLGVIDYRIALPATNETSEWQVTNHGVDEVALFVDGTRVDSTAATRQPELRFTELAARDGRAHELRLTAVIRVTAERTVERQVRRCRTVGGPTQCEFKTVETTESRSEKVNVETQLTVRLLQPDPAVRTVRLGDGRTGLRLETAVPWTAIRMSQVTIRSSWRFFAARETAWDELEYRTESANWTEHSPVHPVQVHAFPSTYQTQDGEYEAVERVHWIRGTGRSATVPADVALDVRDRFRELTGVAVELRGGLPETVRVAGLVGSNQTVAIPEPAPDTRQPPSLDVEVLDRSRSPIRIRITLQDTATGDGLETAGNPGSLWIEETQFQTNETGVAVIELDPTTAIRVRYDPGPWWDGGARYAPAETTLVLGPVGSPFQGLWRLGIIVGLWAGAGFMLSRLTGGGDR